MSPRLPLCASLALALLVFSPIALADPPIAVSGSPAPVPAAPDVVVFKNGDVLRGTVVESIKGDHVTIQLLTGSLKNIPWAEIDYAGSEAERPKKHTAPLSPSQNSPWSGTRGPSVPDATRPFLTVDAAPVHLRLESPSPNTTFHIKTSSAVAGNTWTNGGNGTDVSGYTVICTAPCEATLPAGTHQLALSTAREKAPKETEEPTIINTSSVLTGEYDSNAGHRYAAYAVMSVGPALGIVLLFHGLDRTKSGHCHDCGAVSPVAEAAIGGGLAVLAPPLAWLLIFKSDSATISISPSSTTPPLSASPADRLRASFPSGANLYGSF